MTKTEKATSIHENGYACSQAVLVSFAAELGIDEKTAFKISSTFGGGIGRTGETCGAVAGAIMALGLKYGYSDPPEDMTKTELYQKVNFFLEEFKEKHSVTKCKDLLGFDVSIPEENEIIKEKGISKEKCPNFINDAVEILEDMIF